MCSHGNERGGRVAIENQCHNAKSCANFFRTLRFVSEKKQISARYDKMNTVMRLTLYKSYRKIKLQKKSIYGARERERERERGEERISVSEQAKF